jgi:hypothetical protein
VSQTLTLIARGQSFEYAPSAISLEKNKSIKLESTTTKTHKIKLIYRANTFEYTPKPPSILSYYRHDNRPINWRFQIPANTEQFNFSVFFKSLLNWKDN